MSCNFSSGLGTDRDQVNMITMIPTGNPNIPTTVQEAKEIMKLIVEKMERANVLEVEVFSPDDFDVEDNINENVDDATRDGEAAAGTAEVSICTFILLYSFILTCYELILLMF